MCGFPAVPDLRKSLRIAKVASPMMGSAALELLSRRQI
jgi:hypothetical protein